MCIYFGYLITNLISNKKYIGVHQTRNLEDAYFGSGVHLRRSIAKYGKESFHKEIIEYFPDAHDMYLWEAIMVTQDIVDDLMYYNMKLGGHGGGGYKHSAETKIKMRKPKSIETRIKMSIASKGKVKSKEHCDKISAAKKGMPGHKQSAETKIKIGLANSGHIVSDEARAKISQARKNGTPPMLGKHHSDSTKEKISMSKRKLIPF